MLSVLFLYCGGTRDKYPSETLITWLDVFSNDFSSLRAKFNRIELFLYLKKKHQQQSLFWYGVMRWHKNKRRKIKAIYNKTQITRNQLFPVFYNFHKQMPKGLSVAFVFNMEEEVTTSPQIVYPDICLHWLLLKLLPLLLLCKLSNEKPPRWDACCVNTQSVSGNWGASGQTTLTTRGRWVPQKKKPGLS